MNNDSDSDSRTFKVKGRRTFLKFSSAVWSTPIVLAVALPAHAQTSTPVVQSPLGQRRVSWNDVGDPFPLATPNGWTGFIGVYDFDPNGLGIGTFTDALTGETINVTYYNEFQFGGASHEGGQYSGGSWTNNIGEPDPSDSRMTTSDGVNIFITL